MAYENLCMYCFEDLGGQSTCPHCGRDAHAAVPQIQMLPGSTVYHDRFLIGRALGQDATGIVYAALDTKKQNKLRIREYLPRDCAERLNDGGVVPLAGREDEYDAGIRKLKASVEETEDPARRHFFFEENGTAYIVQRKSAQAQPAEERRHREVKESRGRGPIIAIVAAIAVVAAALVGVFVFGGGLLQPKDVTETPTQDPENVWLPMDSQTPTVTPYTSPTFAALVDPELSWMDFSFEDVDLSASSKPTPTVASAATRVPTATARATATPKPTAAPTLSGDDSAYSTITNRSSAAEIRRLQQRLNRLGWLNTTDITGTYSDATREAVRQFQRYINQNYNPATRLTVDGIAGPKTQQWLYQVNAEKPTATPRITATPTPTPTPTERTAAAADSDAVSADSSANKIRAMQRELILLGVMPDGSDNGVYDAATRSAVRRFQNRVNDLQGYEVLEATGRMDALSMAFLDYYVDEWRTLTTATATPSARVTATPSPTPTTAPTNTPYESEKDPSTVRAGSDRAAVQDLQQQLIAVGLLPEGSDDGVYGASTRQAVTQFQQWVNDRRNEETLSVTGEADPLTRSYLRYSRQNGLRPSAATAEPTATPTPVPAVEPEGEEDDLIIQRGSNTESIRRVQSLLADVGLLNRRGVDGVYGSGTQSAVRAFQEYVNAHGGELEVTGLVDRATRMTLEYYSDNEWTVHDDEATPTPEPTEAPTEAPTEIPTEEPTAEPTQIPTPEPEAEDDMLRVQQMLVAVGALSDDALSGEYDADTAQALSDFQNWINAQGLAQLEVSGRLDNATLQILEYAAENGMTLMAEETVAPAVAQVNSLSITIAGESAGDQVVELGAGMFSVNWTAEGDVESYDIAIYDSQGNVMNSAQGYRDTSFRADADRIQAGEVYTIRIGARPAGGSDEDLVWQTARFTRPEAQPTEIPTPEPLPTMAPIEAPEIRVEGTLNDEGIVEITSRKYTISWGSEGAVQNYIVRITDASGSEVANHPGTQQTQLSLNAGDMRPGEVYTITVGAIPMNGSSQDMVVNSARFTLPVAATAAPTEVPTPVPTAEPTPQPEVAEISRPFVNVGGSGYQRDGVQYMTDSTIILSWGAEGSVANYVVYVMNQNGDRQDLGTTTDTSRTISAGNLPEGIYTIYVGAIPENGTMDDVQWGTARFGIPGAAAPAEEIEEEAPPEEEVDSDEAVDSEEESDDRDGGDEEVSPIDASSSSSAIQALQRQLYARNVMSGEPEAGVLDDVTLQAVATFQARMNEQYDAGLTVLDPDDPDAVVDEETLWWIEGRG